MSEEGGGGGGDSSFVGRAGPLEKVEIGGDSVRRDEGRRGEEVPAVRVR